MRKLLLVLATLLLVVAAVLIFLPARVAVRLAGDRLGALQLQDVSGTLWRGRAERTRYRDHVLGVSTWDVHAATLLLHGALDVDLALSGADTRGSVRLWRRGDVLRLSGLQAELPAQVLRRALDDDGLEPRGRVELALPQAEFEGWQPRALAGTAIWREAALIDPQRPELVAPLGEIRSEFALEADGVVRGRVDDADGPVDVEGGFRLGLDGYRADLSFSARDPAVAPTLAKLGEPDAEGRHRLRVQGHWLRLPPH